jgi:hypothetical protein
MDATTLLVLGALVGLLTAVGRVWWNRYDEGRHRAVATELGLAYSAHDTHRFASLPFAFFQREGRHRTAHVMGNPRDPHQANVFEHAFTPRNGNGNVRSTCALIHVGGWWPHLQIGPEVPGAGLARAFGVRDIELESEAFNERFHVLCDDRRFATAFFDPLMMGWLLEDAPGRLRCEVRGDWALVALPRVHATEMPAVLAFAHRLREHIPVVLWDLYPGANGGAGPRKG